MDVANDSWQLAGDPTPTTLTVQNVGAAAIMVVFEATAPAPQDFLERGDYFVLHGRSQMVSYGNLATEGKSMYVRAMGARTGKLAVSSYAP